MGEIRNSFALWKDLLREGAATAVAEFQSRVDGVANEELHSAVSLRLDGEQIGAHFLAVRGRLDEPLAGIPYLLKDLFDVVPYPTLCSSRLLSEMQIGATADCRVHREMSSSGAVFAGKTHMNEFAYGLDGHNAHFGNVENPRAAGHISGGSSSGSAWAVGKGIVPLAFGTDTGGSIRVPAAFCGVYGFRRPVDEWASDGVFPLSVTFDTVGWFTSTAEDLATTIRVLWEPARSPDGASNQRPAPESGVYVCPEKRVSVSASLADAYREAADRIGATEDPRVREEYERETAEAAHAYNIIGSSDAYAVHKEWLDQFRDMYTPDVWSLIDRGRRWTEEDREAAFGVKARVLALFSALFEKYRFVVLPAVHDTAPVHAEVDAVYRNSILELTTAASLAELPSVTIPVSSGADALTGGIQVLFPRERASVPEEVLSSWRGPK